MAKKALIVALSYKNGPEGMKRSDGCIASTKALTHMLEQYFRFHAESIKYVSDENRNDTPTDREILKELCDMVKGAQKDDILLFVFSGHGGWYPCIYNNNSGHVEFIVTGERDGQGRGITDDTFREVVETVPLECSFTMITDCCRSGALIEGAVEQIGHSTNNHVRDRTRAPPSAYLRHLQINKPSGRYLGILITACQNDESTTVFNTEINPCTLFLPALMSIIRLKGIHISNINLVKELGRFMDENGRSQTPGLYCHPTQKNLKFLSLEEMDESPEPMDIDTQAVATTYRWETPTAMEIDLEAAAGRRAPKAKHSVWCDDAFDRARQLYLSYYQSIPKSLEFSTAHKLRSVLDGYNGTIMAYGQTGTAKTYTIGRLGEEDTAARGIMVRAMEDIFADVSIETDSVSVSYLQLYMETIQDLLDPANDNIPIAEDPKTGDVSLPGATLVEIRDQQSFIELLRLGEAHRFAANKKLNTKSSRSHTILMVHVKRSAKGRDASHSSENGNHPHMVKSLKPPIVRKAKLVVVDLAGSERIDKSGSEGHMLEEAKFINVSLSALGKCINSLAENSAHVPFRDSKLTRLLRDSFGGTAKTSLVITIGPSPPHRGETASTIMFGQRTRRHLDGGGYDKEVGGRDSLTSQIKHQQQVSGNGAKPSIAKLFEQVGLQKILSLLESEDADVRIHAVRVVENLSAEETNQGKIVEAGGLTSLLTLLKTTQDKTIHRVAAGAIANLAMNESNQELIMAQGGISLLSMTAANADDPQTLRMVAGVIANLCGNDKLQTELRGEGGIKALLGMVRCRYPDVHAQVARGIANFAKCESRASTQGMKSGRSFLIEDGALSWIVQNANNETSSIRCHIELALCYLAQHEANGRDMIKGGALWELVRISRECSREDIKTLAHRALASSPAFQSEMRWFAAESLKNSVERSEAGRKVQR